MKPETFSKIQTELDGAGVVVTLLTVVVNFSSPPRDNRVPTTPDYYGVGGDEKLTTTVKLRGKNWIFLQRSFFALFLTIVLL